ncbi:hypothetical protein Glove_360g71 [Diversispora epigaea]|uniref:THH1/TOM1/TOM3 domain-containing protein n=1 Tax=Diversispora epigaea TaxID=1348612 RepID=A0A397H9Z6_9GLOM|nr:hypothetical protein Glove_360g71 [Diversispora epigaea]
MGSLETGVLIGSIVFSSISCVFLIYQCVVNFTKLRLACLLSTLAIFFITICNYCQAQPTSWSNWISISLYWIIFALIRALYTTILVVCMLDMGRKFYGENRWNTYLFKITILQLIVFDAANIVDVIMIYESKRDHSEFPLFLSQLILGVSTITSSFLYAFYPVLTIHMSKSTSPKQINAQSAAVGTWYMTITGILSILYLILYLISFCFNDDLDYNPIGNACDAILRVCITLAISLPPPSNIIHAMKMKIVERMSTYDSPNSRYNTV